MEIYKDTTGEIYNSVVNGLREKLTIPNDLTVGVFSGKVFLAGVIYSVVDKVCYMTINTTNPKWCTRANLSRLFEMPFDLFDIKIVKAVTSHKNKKANWFLRRLKLREEGYLRCSRADGTHEVVFSLTLEELKEKEWYK